MRTREAGAASEAGRIADQLRRAFDGSAWHGPALLELLEDVNAAAAAARPLPDVHSIWELVLHVAVWDDAALRRIDGKKWQPTGLANFPPVRKATDAAWGGAARAVSCRADCDFEEGAGRVTVQASLWDAVLVCQCTRRLKRRATFKCPFGTGLSS